ncbi:MAG: methylglyoxal synthase [Oscillospiraceae bacterium]|nr:methylglyoxal synthase [Oscillospiraceae bacterium]
MNIGIIAHDSKKELMVQFCIAYCGVLNRHSICTTSSMGKLISDATGLHIETALSDVDRGEDQIASRIAYNEIDLLLFFRDTISPIMNNETDANLLRLCDIHNIPVATNIATGEVLIHGLERGDLDWRNIVKSS